MQPFGNITNATFVLKNMHSFLEKLYLVSQTKTSVICLLIDALISPQHLQDASVTCMMWCERHKPLLFFLE